MKPEIVEQLNQYDDRIFFEHHRALVDVAIEGGHGDDVMLTLGFLNDIRNLIDSIKEELNAEPTEQHDQNSE